MGECRPAVVLQWAKYWIGVDLIVGSREKTASIVITNIVAVGRNRATTRGNDISAGGSSFQDCVPDHKEPLDDDAAAAVICVVAGNCAMSDDSATVDPATLALKHSAVRADRTVSDGSAAIDPATGMRLVAANGGVGDQTVAIDSAADYEGEVTVKCGVGNRQRPAAVDAAALAPLRVTILSTSCVIINGAASYR